jgi:type IV pilus assembly protein PilM
MGSIAKHFSKTYIFEDKPLFGLDIGHDTLRVMQFDKSQADGLHLKGYGSMAFDPSAVEDGVVVKPELIAKAVLDLFHKGLIGDISTNRVAVSLPASHAFTRIVQLPAMGVKDIADAVLAEAEQYIPAAIDDLYLDYTTLRENEEGMEVFLVAMPKKIVDSYLTLTRLMGLEAVLFDTTIGATAQLFSYDKKSNIPSVLIDFGAKNTDITVFNHGLVVTGTVAFGGDDITAVMVRTLGVTPQEAVALKSEYGLSPSAVQKQLHHSLEPSLNQLVKEIRRTVRYYEQRYVKEPPIGQVIVTGGSANMPGLVSYLTEALRLPVRSFDPASHVEFGLLRPFLNAERTSFVTVAGLASFDPSEVFA